MTWLLVIGRPIRTLFPAVNLIVEQVLPTPLKSILAFWVPKGAHVKYCISDTWHSLNSQSHLGGSYWLPNQWDLVSLGVPRSEFLGWVSWDGERNHKWEWLHPMSWHPELNVKEKAMWTAALFSVYLLTADTIWPATSYSLASPWNVMDCTLKLWTKAKPLFLNLQLAFLSFLFVCFLSLKWEK